MRDESPSECLLAIDLGIDRFATCVTNTGIEPFAIDGRPLKYQNQWYNKEKSYYQERLRNGLAPNKGKWISKQLQSLDSLRNSRLKDYYHQATAHIIGVILQADVNGACNILRKHGNPNFFADYKVLSRLNIWRRYKKIVPHKHAEHIFCKVSMCRRGGETSPSASFSRK